VAVEHDRIVSRSYPNYDGEHDEGKRALHHSHHYEHGSLTCLLLKMCKQFSLCLFFFFEKQNKDSTCSLDDLKKSMVCVEILMLKNKITIPYI
jgi:hypothetical protein